MSRGDLVDEDLRVCAFHRPVWPWWDWTEHAAEQELETWTWFCSECGLGEPMMLDVIREWDEYPDMFEDHFEGCVRDHSYGPCLVDAGSESK